MPGQKNLLILSYFFPPCKKVGGRRWAKFAKILAERNYTVFVICVDVPYKGVCPWENDTNRYRLNIRRLPYKEHRPYYKRNMRPATLYGKVRYRLSRFLNSIPFVQSNEHPDASRHYGPSLRKAASALILKFNIQTVIVTGGPFTWCYEGMKLKQQFTGLKFILDLRDLWTGGEQERFLTQKEKEIERQKEKQAIAKADTVFTPAERIAEYLRQTYLHAKDKIVLLPHAYDASEMPSKTDFFRCYPGEITMAYGGVLYQNMEPAIDQLISLLQELKKAGVKLRVDIFAFSSDYKERFERAGLSGVVNYHSTIAAAALFAQLMTKDYVLLLRAGKSQEQHFKSTKFYELICLGRPILYFGPEGDVSEFITHHNLGFSGNEDSEALCAKIMDNQQTRLIPDTDFDVSAFEFGHVTSVLESYL